MTEPTGHSAAAVDAAVAAARELGLPVVDATVLHDLFSVVVRLEPASVVVRVPTVLTEAESLEQLARRQQDELSMTSWLAGAGVPVLAPTDRVPLRPVQRDGFSMTFWDHVHQDESAEPDYTVNAERTAALHAAMRGYPGRLAFLTATAPHSVTPALLSLIRRPDLISADEVRRAQRQWDRLEPLVSSRTAFEARFPGVDLQPIHGDCPPANMFAGLDGPRYADFELVTLGPVEWDLAALGPELEAAYDRGAAAAGLRALRPDVLEVINAVGMLRAVATLALADRLPQLVEFLGPAVDQWRAAPDPAG
ncbi:phosphotransferase [Tsukamurella serpentis]